MNATAARRQRCAVYTRKSTEEGLDLEYTSLDAQRDAGAAFIASHRLEGWIPVADDYDDGGFSGATLNRPALQRLMADIRAGLIDIVVVYKIDRLTRSLFDFAELVKVFEEYGTTFVSVTQQINTKDAIGRMMLNVLLAFAQFEREMTAERIRDKFVASKKKGLWMHGIPPLGYDVVDRRLAINDVEAEQVRTIFRRFVALGSILKVVQEIRVKGWCNKTWTTKAGRVMVGQLHDKSSVHKILHCRTYLGEMKHRDQYFENTHAPIIDRALWDEAHALLQVNCRVRAGASRRGKVHFLLKGLLSGPDGRALTPWHTTKANGRTYRYYLSTRDTHEGLGTSGLPRLPAGELEGAVVAQLRRVLRAPEMIEAMIPQAVALDPTLDEAKVTVAMTQVDRVWDQLFPAEQERLVRLLVERVIVSPTNMELRLRPGGISSLAADASTTAGAVA
ncbi:recombinase family protein [Sphingomonas sp.]|jgi:site-specific DNA recombinase|uniref:recombinase family protein n=1 Tax=Sphingomonas sp. TaxID=28214 RepID=UPI001EC7E484|nr:recombinase family protein [Sphingomonas sp.]MBX3595648.1 recombinase family protein [Sphingomonas sp.]